LFNPRFGISMKSATPCRPQVSGSQTLQTLADAPASQTHSMFLSRWSVCVSGLWRRKLNGIYPSTAGWRAICDARTPAQGR